MTNHIQANEAINEEVERVADYVVKEYGVDRKRVFETIAREAEAKAEWLEGDDGP